MPDIPDFRQALLQRRLLAMHEQSPNISNMNQSDPSWYRADGTLKGQGFLGSLLNINGQTSSELSIADSDKLKDPRGDIYPEDNGRESYPSIIPNMTAIELNRALNGNITPSLADKATAFTLARRAVGKSLFATPQELNTNYLPEFRRIK